jgi:Skp family chaperone for outer membrane proteins
MKFFLLITVSLIFAVFAVSVPAQTKKVGVIDTRLFLDGKTGIKKYVDAINAVNAEFKTAAAELDGLALKIRNLENELKAFQEQAQKGIQVNQATVNAKLEEHDRVSREYKFKKEDNEAKYNRRQVALVYPVQQDISNALQEFTKKNGYAIILDISKDRTGLFLAWDEKANITKEFIAFYNARPVTMTPVTK